MTDWQARTTDDVARVAAVLGRAFEVDPMWTWVLGSDGVAERRARLAQLFAAIVGLVHVRHGLIYTAGEFAGAAVWSPPGAWRVGLGAQARLALPLLRALGTGVARLLRLQHTVEHAHLHEPHYYLFALGADPAYQGKGVGAALVAPVLARCDAEKIPAYLESSNPANLGFYRRLGFVVLGELHPGGPDGPLITRMRRDPR